MIRLASDLLGESFDTTSTVIMSYLPGFISGTSPGVSFLLMEGEKYLLLEGGVGEGIFFAGPKHAAIKVVASYTEDQLITTDPRQLLEIEAAKKEFAAAEAKAKDLPLAG